MTYSTLYALSSNSGHIAEVLRAQNGALTGKGSCPLGTPCYIWQRATFQKDRARSRALLQVFTSLLLALWFGFCHFGTWDKEDWSIFRELGLAEKRKQAHSSSSCLQAAETS